jgi:hypothetical protein
LTIEKLRSIDLSEEWLDIFGEISNKTHNEIRLERMKRKLDAMLGRCIELGECTNTGKLLKFSRIIDKLILRVMQNYNPYEESKKEMKVYEVRR